MQANVKWVEGDTFIGRSNSNHNVVFDGGSDSAAPSPMEMVLMSVGCCSSVDVVSILKKLNKIFQTCKCNSVQNAPKQHRACLPKSTYTLLLKAIMCLKKHLARAVSLSAEKYCSVALMLDKTVEITHSHEVVQDQAK
ncbi:OsmC family protein [Pseudoalteromonas sp. B193]